MEAKPRLYIIDTSSIIEPRRLLSMQPQREVARVYAALSHMVDEGEMMFPSQVFDELDRFHEADDDQDRAYFWAKKHKDAAAGEVPLAQLFESVRSVQETVDNLVDYSKASPTDDADPYVVGLALYFKNAGFSVTVVTEDRVDRANKTSMQSACAMLELPALSLRAFLKLRGIWPKA